MANEEIQERNRDDNFVLNHRVDEADFEGELDAGHNHHAMQPHRYS